MRESQEGHIYKAAGIIIHDRKILVERSKGKTFFIAPGGSIEEGETEAQALVRELREEFRIRVLEEDLEEFGRHEAPAAGQEHRIVHMAVYMVKKFQGEPRPDNEVEEIAWVNSRNDQDLTIGSIFGQYIIPRLTQLGLID